MQRRQFNLSLEEAVTKLRSDLTTMKQEPRGILTDITPDDAFEAGFNVCLQSLVSYTGSDPSKDGRMTQLDLDLGDQFEDDTKENDA